MGERTRRAFYAVFVAAAVMATVMFVNTESHTEIREEGTQAMEETTGDATAHLAVAKVTDNKDPVAKSANKKVQGLQLDAVRKIQVEKLKKSAAHHPIKIDSQEKKRIQTLIATVSKEFESTTAKSKAMATMMTKAAHKRSVALQHNAKVKASAVVAQARKKLKAKINALSTTLTASMDARQQAAEKLKELQAKQADEVELAEASLALAKVNKATHNANGDARKAAKRAHEKAAARIKFARNMLATRLKAIKNTERLTTNKAELQANVVRTEAEEALSRTRQQVLLEMDDSDDSLSLAEIVGSDAVAHKVTSKQERSDQKVTDEELLGTSAEQGAPVQDTIYTAKMGTCKFPFMYNGEKLYHCKSSKVGHWCATATDETHAVKKWDYCVQNRKVVLLAKEAAMRAAKIEISRVLSETGERALSPGALRESLRAAAAARTSPKPAAPVQSPATEKAPGMQDATEATKQVDAMINGN